MKAFTYRRGATMAMTVRTNIRSRSDSTPSLAGGMVAEAVE